MITGEVSHQIEAKQQYFLNDIKKIPSKMACQKVENCLKKKTQPEHKYSITFGSKVGTIKLSAMLEKKSG